jgi:hypothetical protein
MDLRLHDPDGPAQFVGRFLGFLRREGDHAAGHGHAELRQQALGLILMDIH